MNQYPWWLFPPPQNAPNPKGKNIQKAIDRAVNQRLRELNRPKFEKRKRRDEMMKKAAQGRAKFFTNLELFILGIIAYPIVGPLYAMLIAKLTSH